jgi:AraC-like DNA-binding protein
MPRPTPPAPAAASAHVSTVLTPAERLRVDAAGAGLYRALHRESLDDVLRDLRERRAGAVLVSVTRCAGPQGADATRVATVVREFPRVPAVALLSAPEGNLMGPDGGQAALARAVLSLGRCGVERLVDVRSPAGWRELRSALGTDPRDDFERGCAVVVARDVAGAPLDCVRFFHLLFRPAPGMATVRELSQRLGVVPSTLMSRFFRAHLPAPKRYLAMARLVRAARLFESPGLSVAAVSNALEYSSPQSFGRHVRTMLRLTAVQFREEYDGEGMLERFRAELVLPFAAALRRFAPLTVPPGWLGAEGKRRLTEQ